MALLAVTTFASAQVKTSAEAKAMIDKAVAATQNEKKAAKAGTWINLGKAYMAAYDAPIGEVWTGASKQELNLTMKEQPQAVSNVRLSDGVYTKEVYEEKNLYFNQMGQLAIVEVTKPVDEDALGKAAAAYAKAYSLDPKKAKDVSAALTSIGQKCTNDAYSQYSLGNVATASLLFEKVADIVANPPLSQIDTNSIYNAGFTAWLAGNNDRAKEFFEKSVEIGYYGEDGETYAKLADIAEKAGDAEKSKDYLEEGFQKFPQSQSILVGLINYYLGNNGSTDRLFELLGEAKKNEPNNASLYYVEGNICNQLGKIEDAVAAYDKCAEIDPNYAYGFIGKGQMFYNQAIKYSEEASNEMDDAKYMALVEKFESSLKACIEPFEKALDVLKDENTKVAVAEYLKNACFRFRTADESYQQKYEKYSAMVAGAQQ